MFCSNLKQQLNRLEQANLEKEAVLKAMDRALAMIEFDPQGNILGCNHNFQQVMGYSEEAVRGKHHSLFVSKQETASAGYARFWQRLRQGEFFSGRYKRLRQDGTAVWLEATYNPVINSNGEVVKVIKLATDITAKVERELYDKAQMEALNKVMAVITFDLQGNILDANDNFLKATGYQLDEIQHRHHRLFVTPEYAASEEYALFWKQLAQGIHQAGTFERRTKNGEPLWLEASYNPILDDEGQPFRIVKYATDVSQNENTRLLRDVIDNAGDVLQRFSQGDLTARMREHLEEGQVCMFRPEINQLTRSIGEMAEKLDEVIASAIESSNVVQSAAGEVSNGAADLNQRVQEQAAALEQTSSTMHQMNASVQNNSANARHAAKVSNDAQLKAGDGVKVMQQTIEAINAIQEASTHIAEIVSLIDSIAFQTNLLALNAAVEAARAGEHGRGFAVVAGEVRNLAQKSAEAAKDINKLINDSVAKVTQGTKLASESGEALQEINNAIQAIVQLIKQIADASDEQATGIEQVHQAITQIDDVTQQNAALVEQTSAAADSMNEQATRLRDNMRFFKLSAHSNQAAPSANPAIRSAPQTLTQPAKPVAKPSATLAPAKTATNTDQPIKAAIQQARDTEWEDF
ncbi:methyl-accepting chemotaxis protein [Thiomicrorhabdus cannonii]|uniref:methyl-accepting chemotaxis protein n=1 Tax=Thiomicrorhabdus cannonii TaxID=2748011 RepID=UPI0015BEB681|nr:methyl-accepting chemotaxis protein [Thiomicrorhabdus cannonii]